MDTPTLIQMAGAIAHDAGPYYNVVYMPDSEYRAYALRYLLTGIYHKPPMGIDAYPSADELYVVASSTRSLDNDIPWEVSSFHPISRSVFYTAPNGKNVVYKLGK